MSYRIMYATQRVVKQLSRSDLQHSAHMPST